ncbi:D-alanyl-D-alanine carboxypeptidase family protein [Cylindrospermopsis raciborskii LB2897]|uniref:M15 family metallopeptidase n=1 Tax=Cylindrospermopsis raciborskii TaxID=77022 RepID=UPI001454CA86|nr:M15 family metallopeptidase [Cylindrospermopsis raciborskii]MBG0744467.1 D-alanyl-D-alanine carboxypeptidase family protein [Cylindrospermopsis raciborskii KL1]NLQ08094.1 D-alanyl-D-alanine carboxypeptidase family protein [Cylindrospermopsis raciborskii LB2897]
MKNGGLPGNPENSLSNDDIPAALRDTPENRSSGGFKPMILVVGGVLGFAIVAVGSGFLFFITAPKKNTDTQSTPLTSIPSNTSSNNAVLGHLAYNEALLEELSPITADGKIKMRRSAAQKFQAMIQSARTVGVMLVPISGFRSIQEQEQLFFKVGAQRNQTPAERAALSAPPGYSEHHTGYAVDIGDGAVPGTNLSPTFENTKAFAWLQSNAARFGFELSFPRDNLQGVSYEPWHWRFVGDRDSLETFYKAKNIKPLTSP